MKRSRTHKSAVGVSLFPFLAVLICTMGALIVLLVLVLQMARVNASENTRDVDPSQPRDVLQTEQENHRWRHELLSQQRSQMLEQSSSKRLELSHLEQHIRELEREWELLQQANSDLKRRLNDQQGTEQGARERLRQLEESIRAAEKELDEARQRAAQRPPMYAIVPYEGPHGTYRRPIYVECLPDGVVIQPEGVTFPLSDFQGPLGPGNPIDAALRAIREYYARVGPDGQRSEPYPLLVVRPGGVESYAMVRAAMRSWDGEFGYELIEDDMQLKYPDADPALAQLIRKATVDARSRQAVLAAAMPSKFGNEHEIGFVASATNGGFVPASGAQRRNLGHRVGGFGQGGDSRHVDGRATGPVEGQVGPASEQTVGGFVARGHAEGTPGASVGESCSPLAKHRGPNWGLPGANANATGIVRPIRIAVLPDRVILLPDRGELRVPEVVLIEDSMVDEIDEFVAKVWDRIDEWGMALANGYWKPVLRVSVAQGADARFQEMQVLLDGSGLDIQRSGQ